MPGWVKAHREIQDHWIWSDKPWSFGQAWVTMIQDANWRPGRWVHGDRVISVPRGSYITSYQKMASKFGWGMSRVRRFLGLLENDGSIRTQSERKWTMITICNYDIYNEPEISTGTQTERQRNDSGMIAESIEEGKKGKEGGGGGGGNGRSTITKPPPPPPPSDLRWIKIAALMHLPGEEREEIKALYSIDPDAAVRALFWCKDERREKGLAQRVCKSDFVPKFESILRAKRQSESQNPGETS